MESNFNPKKILIDKGFDSDFSWDRINDLCDLFSDDKALQAYVYKMHDKDNALDLKRGEFYPELLRAIISIKKCLGNLYEIDPTQVHPNFGSNGSIDTILSAVKVEESKRLYKWSHKIEQFLLDVISSFKKEIDLEKLITEIEKDLYQARRQGGVLLTSPTYFRNYNSASSKKLAINLVPLTDGYQFDTRIFIDSMLSLKPSIVFWSPPNNPTGLPIPDKDLLCVLDEMPQETWALIDRTLVNIKPEMSSKDLLNRYVNKNVVILHSFSKYRGMSHHRIGVALYSNPTMANLVQPHLPLGIGLEGCLKANQVVSKEKGIYPSTQIMSNIKESNVLLKAFVGEFPDFRITDFSGNYCLMTLPNYISSLEACDLLSNKGLYVMGGHDFPEPDESVLRLHVGGPPEYTERLCNELAGISTK